MVNVSSKSVKYWVRNGTANVDKLFCRFSLESKRGSRFR
jgi:hypothetical protein